ncbi:MAG: YcgJ family protein [Cyanobium sp.]
MLAVLITPAWSQGQGIDYPSTGVVCDQIGRVCYDSYGPSASLTGDYFGREAADNVVRNLSQGRIRDFRLSNGQACVIAKRTCYRDGWSQQQIAPGLTRQLFGVVPDSGSTPGQGQVARDGGLCSLSRSSQRVFDGPCTLKQVRDGNGNRFVITLQNGSRYVFNQDYGGNYRIRDGFGGSWPVTFVDHGDTGIFRFGDYKLVATQTNGGRQPGSSGEALGNALGELLKSLFR